MENTILSSLNPTEVACATITISVTTDAMKNNNIIYVGGNALEPTNEIATRDANRILNFYLRHFENGKQTCCPIKAKHGPKTKRIFLNKYKN